MIATIIAVVGISVAAHATDYFDFLNPAHGTAPVALTGGDSPTTSAVACATGSTATLLIAAVNAGPSLSPVTLGRPLRKRCFQNSGNIAVAIGSSTVSASDLWVLGESTNTAILPSYCTQNTGAFYCYTKVGAVAQTVNILIESQSQP